MSNSKISALTPASTPLAGTEVLPIVQGGITEQVSVAKLTAGRDVSVSGLFVDANSATAAIRITQLGTGNAFLVEDSSSPDSTPFVIDGNGRIAVGYISPIVIEGAQQKVELIGDATDANLALARFQDSTTSPAIYQVKSRGTVGSPTIVQSGDTLGAMRFSGYDGASFIQGCAINISVDGAPSLGSMPGRLTISTTKSGASSPTEAVRIDSNQSVGIGSSALTGVALRIGRQITGAVSAFSVYANQSIQSDVTTSATIYRSLPSTAAAAFTLPTLIHYEAAQNTIGAGSAVTNQYGFNAASTLIGATNNYGFYGGIAAAAGRYNFYAAGTAQNLFSGDVLVFGAGGLGYTTGSGGTVTQGTSRTTGVTLNKTNGAITLFSAAGSTTFQSFTVTNSTVAATDVIHVVQKSGTDKYAIWVTAVAAGSFQLTFATLSGTTTEQPVFNFAVLKAVTA